MPQEIIKPSFLKPTFAKFIIPILLLVFLAFVYIETRNVGLNFWSCEFLSEDKGQEEILEENYFKLFFSMYSNLILSEINPLYPVDCMVHSSDFCGYYFSEENYLCIKNSILSKEGSSGFGSLLNSGIMKYKKPSMLLLLLNAFLFFIAGYLISCTIAWVYNKIKSRNQQQ
jgi:ABC-type sugar transport system permease subunit